MRGTGRKGRHPSFKHMHVDCDPLVYQIGFRCEDTVYIAGGAKFKALKDAIAHCEGMDLDREDIIKQITPWEWPDVLRELETKLRQFQNLFTPSKTYLYLSPSKYFRYDLTDDYKGNRTGNNKPYHFAGIREFFMRKGAKLIDNMEADDILAINHFHHFKQGGFKKTNRNSLIVGEDKDFNNIPGWHYQPGKQKLFYQGSYSAIAHFYQQMIAGDTADNIKGIPGKGQKAAEKLIDPDFCDEKRYWRIVKDAYLEYAKKKEISEYDIIDQMLLNAHLLYILWEKDTWFIPPLEEDRCQNLKWLEKIKESMKASGS